MRVEVQVHEGEAAGALDQLLAEVGLRLDALRDGSVQAALRLGGEPLVGGHEEAAGAHGGVADGEVRALAGVRAEALHDRLDEDPRGEVLAGALLALGRGLLEEALVGGGLDVDAEGRPVGLVDQGDELLQVDRVVEPGLGTRVDVAQDAGRLAELPEGVDVVVGEFRAAAVADGRPGAALRDLDVALVRHLEEEEVRDLLDVVAVVDSVVAEGVAEAPELLDDVTHAAMASGGA